jgi:hypothetical protein
MLMIKNKIFQISIELEIIIIHLVCFDFFSSFYLKILFHENNIIFNLKYELTFFSDINNEKMTLLVK